MAALQSSSTPFIVSAFAYGLNTSLAAPELIAAVLNASVLSDQTAISFTDAIGNPMVSNHIQNAILGLNPISQLDLRYLGTAFSSDVVGMDIATNAAGGLADKNGNVTYPTVPTAVVATPSFSVPAGSYGPTQSVSLSCATFGALMYFTVNGSTPTTGSTLYTGSPISVSSSETVKVLAVKSGFINSAIASAAYVINGAVATATFSPVAGSYTGTQSVTVSSTTSGATFYYSTDGSTPTTASALYSGPISVAVSETIKVLGVKAGFSNSAIASAAYVIS